MLAACQATTRETVSDPTDGPAAACESLFLAVDRRVSEAGAVRSFPHRLAGFPYLRSTRVLASFRDDIDSDAGAAAWFEHLSAADRRARESELAQVPSGERRQLTRLATTSAAQAGLSDSVDLHSTLNECRDLLVLRDRGNAGRMKQLRSRVVPEDEYSMAQRIGGLYPLTSLGVRAGVARWHESVRDVYSDPAGPASVAGDVRRYAPAPAPAPAAASGREVDAHTPVARDALDIPRPDEARLDALYRRHAPVWEIDTASAADIPGRPVWQRDGRTPGVDSADTVIYRYSSITRFKGRPRLQLNYLAWFDERPATGPLDALAGRLDGVIWRVTLDEEGDPMVYDSVHACGCYHLLFPVGDLALRPAARRLPEPPLVPATLDAPAPGTRVHLRLSAGAHYLEGVSHRPADSESTLYRLADRDALYATPVAGGGRRSLFREDGLVAGTGRAERWFLWPTGVRSPGAMRERGRRATAFVGRRHFDDAYLLDTLLQ